MYIPRLAFGGGAFLDAGPEMTRILFVGWRWWMVKRISLNGKMVG